MAAIWNSKHGTAKMAKTTNTRSLLLTVINSPTQPIYPDEELELRSKESKQSSELIRSYFASHGITLLVSSSLLGSSSAIFWQDILLEQSVWKAHVDGHIPILSLVQSAPDVLCEIVQKLKSECIETFYGMSRVSRKDGRKIKAAQSCHENDVLRDLLKYLIRQKHQSCLESRCADDIVTRICDFDNNFFDVRLSDSRISISWSWNSLICKLHRAFVSIVWCYARSKITYLTVISISLSTNHALVWEYLDH